MPLIRYSPWADAAQVGEGLGGSLTNLLFKLPELQMQQQLLRQHAQLYQQQGDLYSAEASRAIAQKALYGQQLEEGKSEQSAKDKLGNALWSIAMSQAAGQDFSPHVARAVDAMARLPDKDRSNLAENLSQMLSMKDPRFQQALGTKTKMFESVPSGNTLYNVLSQQPEYQAPIRLGTGEGLYPQAGGPSIALGPPKLPNPASQGFGNAVRYLLDPMDSPLSDEQKQNLGAAIYGHLVNAAAGTNVAPAAPAPAAQRKVVRDPKTGELILQ